MLAIETRALCKTYGQRRVVDNFTMHVPEGAIYGFVGKNGAGKSTVMKMIDSLVTPTSGEILLYENVVNGTAESGVRSNRRIGALIEDPGLYPALTATDNLMCKALAIGLPNAKARCEEILRTVGLEYAAKTKVKKFSLGMKQRLGVGLALLASPDLLLLDEPFNGLDPEATRDLRILIETMNRVCGVTVVISSHVLDQLDRIATCYGVIANGRMIREMSAEQVEQECGDSLRVKTDNPERALVLLQEKLPTLTYVMEPGNTIRVKGAFHADKIATTLHESGMVVLELSVMKRDIEDYFVELMEGGVCHV